MQKRSSRLKDTKQLARKAVGVAGPDAEQREKNPAAVALGRLGGLKGGQARAEKLSKKKLSEIARKAAQARWSRDKRG
jgi:hypothetical protein